MTRQDLYSAAVCAARQAALGWFKAPVPGAAPFKQNDDATVRIDDCYTYFARPLLAAGDGVNLSTFNSSLPLSLQNAVKAFFICRQWVEVRLEAAKDKVTALNEVLDALAMTNTDYRQARQRNGRSGQSKPVIPTFTMRVLVAALISPVSRQYRDAWSIIALENGCAPDTTLAGILTQLQPSPALFTTGPVDLGWVLERIIQIVDHGVSSANLPLIDFAKQRLVLQSSLLRIRPD
jgi:hypothetical protein